MSVAVRIGRLMEVEGFQIIYTIWMLLMGILWRVL